MAAAMFINAAMKTFYGYVIFFGIIYGFGIGLNYFVTISMVAWKFWPNINGILAINISNHLKGLLLD